MAQLFSLGHIHIVYYYDTYVCSIRTSGRRLVGGYSDSYLSIFRLRLDISVALEFDDAGDIWSEAHQILAGVSAYVACQPTIW